MQQYHTKRHRIMLSDRITLRRNYENLIIQVHNFIIENGTWNLKFFMFHADDINSVKCILRKVKRDKVDKLCDTRTEFCASYLSRIQPQF